MSLQGAPWAPLLLSAALWGSGHRRRDGAGSSPGPTPGKGVQCSQQALWSACVNSPQAWPSGGVVGCTAVTLKPSRASRGRWLDSRERAAGNTGGSRGTRCTCPRFTAHLSHGGSPSRGESDRCQSVPGGLGMEQERPSKSVLRGGRGPPKQMELGAAEDTWAWGPHGEPQRTSEPAPRAGTLMCRRPGLPACPRAHPPGAPHPAGPRGPPGSGPVCRAAPGGRATLVLCPPPHSGGSQVP